MTITVDPLSIRSNKLELLANNEIIGSATGFIVKSLNEEYYLVSNWHVFSGRSVYDQQPRHSSGAVPDQVRVFHHKSNIGEIQQTVLDLVDQDGLPSWLSHPQGHRVDVAALKIQDQTQMSLWPFDMELANTDLTPEVSQGVSIIGFPYGITTHGSLFPVWKRGHVASEPQLPYNGMPSILIDATTREGMSGSPVVITTSGPYRNKSGSLNIIAGSAVLFLGIYSGRLSNITGEDSHLSSELGLVWKPNTILEIINSQ